MSATVGEFGLVSGLQRGGSRSRCQGHCRSCQGGGENISRPQVSAKDEPRDLHLDRAVTRLGCCVYQRSVRVVSTRDLAHRAARRVSRARVQGSGLTGCTRHEFARPSGAQAESTYSFDSITGP